MKINYNLTFCIYFIFFGITSCTLNPIVFIPGDGGSQLEAKLNKSSVVHYVCEKSTSGFFNIWLNLELLVPLVIDCWVDNVKLNYDNVTRKTFNQPGVETRIPGFGSSETVEWLDPSHASTGAYFKYIGDILVKLGHERNITIKGAPYDFRKAPNENQEYFENLKNLIETAYDENGNQSVMLIAHSMGGPMSLQLLSRQKQSWKDKYIKCLITLAGAWGGSVKAVKVYAIGDDLGSYALRESVMKQEQITSPSLSWMLPNQYFWDKDEVLVQTSKKNFSLSNIEEYFRSLNFPIGWEMRKDTLPYQQGNIAPGVEVHCLFGVNITTVERLYYKPGTWLDGYPTLINGDGDGTVNRRSLEGCLRWSKMQSQPVHYQAFPKVDHMGILKEQAVLNYISNLINSV
ncbi:group XV phospholipase A2 isoform X2 [Agrilus planipennis]|uniref:Group XV phospholipase A2 isoform X2 n=1 Tax=Agrilus planipennis TaxID=224129 RepID=A0A7F5RKH5_AGRPL|nr:group XV phospholipase A2 isoform X2 [Agrilus planipennis]